MGGSSLTGNCTVEKSSSLHLSAELNCGISLEVGSLFSQRCDLWLFFSPNLLVVGVLFLETASCCGLWHCSCVMIQYQEQSGEKGTRVRQCYSMKVSSQLCRLSTVKTLITHLSLTEKGTIVKQHSGCSALRWASVHRNFRLPALGNQDSKTSARILKIVKKILGFYCLYLLGSWCLRGYKASRPMEERTGTNSDFDFEPLRPDLSQQNKRMSASPAPVVSVASVLLPIL